MAETYGPTYYDVERLCEDMRSTYGGAVEVLLVPPHYIRQTGVKTSWMCSCRFTRMVGDRAVVVASQTAFGRNGAHKTLPAAMWHAVEGVRAKLEAAETERVKQTAF